MLHQHEFVPAQGECFCGQPCSKLPCVLCSRINACKTQTLQFHMEQLQIFSSFLIQNMPISVHSSDYVTVPWEGATENKPLQCQGWIILVLLGQYTVLGAEWFAFEVLRLLY